MKEFDKVIGYASIKKELIQISDVLANSEAYQKLGVVSPRGLLLYGDPGVGKTLMATSLINASGRKAFICRKDKPNGDFIKEIKKTFKDAVDEAPSIVFLDDMDKFSNGDEGHRDAEEYVTVQSCIDEVKNKEVFVLATANRLRVLPRSLLRAGRFDRMIQVNNPRGADAVKIIEHYIRSKKFVGDMDAVTVARIMDGRSCAELETVINEAGLYAGFERSCEITMDHFMRACLHSIHDVPNEVLNESSFTTDLTNSKDPRTRIIYHEAGHAAISEALNPGSVTLISAYSRDGESGGFTSYYRSGFADTVNLHHVQILSSLGGVAALEQKFGTTDMGSSRDLDQAFNMVRNMITENCAAGFYLHCNDYGDSQELKAKQEQATAAEIERYYRKAKELLAVNNALFEGIAKELSVKGVLTAADIRQIRDTL